MLAVRWYLRFGLSYRNVEELLAERGIGTVALRHPASSAPQILRQEADAGSETPVQLPDKAHKRTTLSLAYDQPARRNSILQEFLQSATLVVA